jgi:hypothetical protein
MTNKTRLFRHLFVEVAPEPFFVGLGGGDDGVLGGVEVLGGVLVFGGVAAADVPAGETGAEVDPGVAEGDALFADVDFGGGVVAVAEVFAKGHGEVVARRTRGCGRRRGWFGGGRGRTAWVGCAVRRGPSAARLRRFAQDDGICWLRGVGWSRRTVMGGMPTIS